jgi:MinD-like ATPase involved in chromosome partitioning or flagellar assembly
MEALEVVPRSAVAISLPRVEFEAVRDHLAEAGYEALHVRSSLELETLLRGRSDIQVAILDTENDFDGSLEMYGLLHDGGRAIPALLLMPSRSLGRMGIGGKGYVKDEYFTRPFSAESLRWRVEAMLIRVENVPADSVEGILIQDSADPEAELVGAAAEPAKEIAEAKRGKIAIVFNPKGGVGKTTISINLGTALQMRKKQRVLLIDCDTITGHVGPSLGLASPRTLARAWRDAEQTGAEETITQIASVHASSGVSVLVLASTPLHTEILEPKRVAAAINAAREDYDWVILDMHPDYGPLNQALFQQADTILVPVTPDVPCIRAAVQFREVAVELDIRDRLTVVINRSNSGVAASDVQRVVAVSALARVRSAGMLFVRAADEGKSAVERFPDSKVVGDIDVLAERLITGVGSETTTKMGVISRERIRGTFKGLFDRLTAQVS